MKPIILASDHGGFELKEHIKAHLFYKDYQVQDVGTNGTDSVDYPVFVKKGVELVKHHNTYGIFVCGSGIGVSIAANRHKGIRAALVHSEIYAQLCRQHNNANVLCLGGRFIDKDLALKLVDMFLETTFLAGRYADRLQMLEN